jgi:hypothetical protein
MTKLSLVYAVAVMLAGIFAVRRSKAILPVSDNPKTIIGVAAIALIYRLAAFGHFFIPPAILFELICQPCFTNRRQ